MKPCPGWLVVKPIEADERYRESHLVMPDSVRARITQYQVELLAVPRRGGHCEDDTCNRWHDAAGYHEVPEGVIVGAWALTAPRPGVAIPRRRGQWLIALDDLLAVLETG